jgi:S1-C subfamily serine protease
MRRLPFFMTLAVGVSTVLFVGQAALAQEADAAAETGAQATTDVQAETDAAGTNADSQTDASAETSDAGVSASAGAGTDSTSNQTNNNQQSAVNPEAPAASASAGANLNSQGQAQVQGSTGAGAQLNTQNQPLPSGRATGAQQPLNTDQRSNATQGQAQLNAGQPGSLSANGQLSAQALDQRLGLEFDDVNRSAVNRAANQGLAIRTIQPNSVFYSSGLRQGDVLLSVDNRPFVNRTEFSRVIATYPQNRVPLMVMRNGQRQTIYFNRPADFVAYDQPTVQSQAVLGVTFDSSRGGGAVIRAVTPNSPAEQAGIMSGDIITGLNGQPVLAANEVIEMIAAMQPGQQVTIDIARQQQKIRTDAVLAARSTAVRHSVGYAPDPAVQPVPIPGDPVIRENRTYRALPVRPGDPDRDGRVLDGDGRIPRRVLNDRR